ncbi:MAG: hypothetical protein K2N94_16005 [Lachnospiraceae bacterium]|nr:hypothetical protein [Lachnospiraceae bacterium]
MKSEWEKRIRQYQRRLRKEPLFYGLSMEMYTKNVRAAAVWFVLAPVLCGYVLQVLQEAERSGKKRLYFLARDGWQMYQIAKTFCEKLELPLECRYLYCSRYALRAAEYAVRGEAALDYLCLGGIYVTAETVFHRAGIFEQEEIKRMAELLPIEDCKRQLSHPELKKLKDRLAASTEFMEQLTRRSGQAYTAAIGYLRQEGMFDRVPYALVDSGWSGSIQQSFRHLLNHAGKTGEIEGYYFGLYEYPEGVDRSTYHTWYFSPTNKLLRKTTFNNNLFECVCSSPEGMTEGYCFQNGVYAPRLVCRTSPNAARAEEHTAYFTEYAEKLGERLKKRREQPGERVLPGQGEGLWKKKTLAQERQHTKRKHGFLKTSERLLSLLMGSPTVEEAGEYGSYVFCDDVIGEENQRLAADLSKSEIKANRLLPQIKRKYFRADARERGSAWLEASTVLACGRSRGVLWHCRVLQWVRCFRKQVRAWSNQV